MESPRIVCHTIWSADIDEFDQKVSEELNKERWDRFTYQLVFKQDEHSFYAHIIFTEITEG